MGQYFPVMGRSIARKIIANTYCWSEITKELSCSQIYFMPRVRDARCATLLCSEFRQIVNFATDMIIRQQFSRFFLFGVVKKTQNYRNRSAGAAERRFCDKHSYIFHSLRFNRSVHYLKSILH